MAFSLTENEKNVLLAVARNSIEAQLHGTAPAHPEPTDSLKQQCGAFVTLHRREALRGCIGHIMGVKPLWETVQEMARAAAFQDPRFPPLSRAEWPDIHIEISVLTPLERAERPSDIRPGTDGTFIRRGPASGVLLPQVATEQGWDRETFLRHTCRKAGLPGDCWQEPDTELYRFQAIVFGEYSD
jgi:AmmeMemoRadiSam system protein A